MAGAPVDPRTAVAILSAGRTLTLCTFDGAGPWAAPVWYARAGGSLLFCSSPRSRHALALAADPRAAGAVHAETADPAAIRGVQMAGRAGPVPDERRDAARAAYLARFPFAAPLLAAAPAERFALYEFVPETLFLVDARAGFGRVAVDVGLLQRDGAEVMSE